MNVFRRPSVRYGATPEPETPYQRAAQVWDERIGSARVQAKNWRLMAFGSLFLSAGLAFGLVWQSARGSIVPWVVQIDKIGEAQAVGPAIADYKPINSQIAWHLARFIEQVRAIPVDAVIVRQNWLRAYEFTTDRGAAGLNDYARANDPFAKVGKRQVAVEVSSVIRASPVFALTKGPAIARPNTGISSTRTADISDVRPSVAARNSGRAGSSMPSNRTKTVISMLNGTRPMAGLILGTSGPALESRGRSGKIRG